MLVLRLPKGKLAENVAAKFRRAAARGLVVGEVAVGERHVYIVVADEALSAAFVYGAYALARWRGVEAELFHAVSVNPEALPEEVRRVGEAWISRRLRKEEVERLKNKFITVSVLEAIMSIE